MSVTDKFRDDVAVLSSPRHCFLSLDVAPLSAPAFSFCFPLLNAMLRESSGSTEETENMMTRALQVVSVHSQLRASTDSDDIVIDEVETNVSSAVLFSLSRTHR